MTHTHHSHRHNMRTNLKHTCHACVCAHTVTRACTYTCAHTQARMRTCVQRALTYTHIQHHHQKHLHEHVCGHTLMHTHCFPPTHTPAHSSSPTFPPTPVRGARTAICPYPMHGGHRTPSPRTPHSPGLAATPQSRGQLPPQRMQGERRPGLGWGPEGGGGPGAGVASGYVHQQLSRHGDGASN